MTPAELQDAMQGYNEELDFWVKENMEQTRWVVFSVFKSAYPKQFHKLSDVATFKWDKQQSAHAYRKSYWDKGEMTPEAKRLLAAMPAVPEKTKPLSDEEWTTMMKKMGDSVTVKDKKVK